MTGLFTELVAGGLPLAADAASGAWNSGTLYAIAFYVAAALTIGSCLMLLMVRDVVRAVFLLLGALGGVAMLYALLGADFVAMAQVLVYIGGIMVLLLFGVMLTNREPVLLQGAPTHKLVLPGFIAAAVIFLGSLQVVMSYDWAPQAIAAEKLRYSADEIGFLFMTDYLLLFECHRASPWSDKRAGLGRGVRNKEHDRDRSHSLPRDRGGALYRRDGADHHPPQRGDGAHGARAGAQRRCA
ncbi:MAG: NADH-quinone oxidoreductase subunit J family protein [Planctomycetota bacterium]